MTTSIDRHQVEQWLSEGLSLRQIGQRQGFWSKTHGCAVQECCKTLQPLSSYGDHACTLPTQHTPPTSWAQGCFLNPLLPPRCNPLQIQGEIRTLGLFTYL